MNSIGVLHIRRVDVNEIEKMVANLCVDANCHLNPDVVKLIRDAAHHEASVVGVDILNQIIENSIIANNEEMPICQDTGFAIVFIYLGQDVLLTNGDLTEAVNKGVRLGYNKGYLRKSMVKDPLDRVNTEDNTPAIIHLQIVPGDQIEITVAPKGGGSENMSTLKMLKPADGEEGVKNFVLDSIKKAGSNPCPPVVVGIGIGGSMEQAALMSKHALIRPIGQKASDSSTARLEGELLEAINKTGIGPQGLGGHTTALAVHIERFPTHIACLPVAINISCHAYRHKTGII